MSDLFRKEAVSHATRRIAGDVVLASSLSSRILAGVLVGVVFSVVAFAATASYARRETIPGWLAPSGGMIRLTARQGGQISEIHVGEDDWVTVGQRVATLSLSPELSSGDSFAALSESLVDQGEAADAGGAAAIAALEAEQRQITDRKAAYERELVEVRRQISLQNQRMELAQAEVDRAEAIAEKGFLPRREVEARRSAQLSVQEEGAALAAQALALQREIGDVSARLTAIPIAMQAARAAQASDRAGLDQMITETEAASAYIVAASVAGKVAALPFNQGQTIEPGAAVAVLTAGNAALEAELYAPSRAVGFVRAGQEVRLMYQAFPHQKFGTGRGVVTSVSRTVLAPSEVAIPGLQVEEPVFRVRVKLAQDSVSAYGESIPLQPGMLVSADVIIDRRTLLEWLLDPLYAAGRRQ